MTYADRYLRSRELADKLGPKSIVDAIHEDIRRRRVEASAMHMAKRIRAQRRTAFLEARGR
ncbi:hypothetical protein [Achromobacter aloeverae]|nr:hypothetical protein [Achromobacter aloeverae]